MNMPDEVRDRLIALADANEHVWQAAAAITLELLDMPGAQKMMVYADVAACLGMKSAGVRAWCSVYKAVRDDLLQEFPQFRITHWRMLIAGARRLGRPLADLVMEWARTADAYAGMPIPPDALAAKLGKPREDDEGGPFEKAIERACRAIVSAQRLCDDDGILAQLETIYEDLERIYIQHHEGGEHNGGI